MGGIFRERPNIITKIAQGSFRILRPRTASEALDAFLSAEGGAKYVAGATVVQFAWSTVDPRAILIDLSALMTEPVIECFWRGTKQHMRISCMATLERLRNAPLVRSLAPNLTAAITSIAAVSIRTLATLGGNIAWRTGDLVPLFLAADALVVLLPHRTEPLAAWLTNAKPEDILVAVEFSLSKLDLVQFEKIGFRASFTPSLLTLAIASKIVEGRIASARVAVGGGANHPGTLDEIEVLLLGKVPYEIDPYTLADAFQRSGLLADDPYASLAHRAMVASRVIRGRLTSVKR